MANLCEKLITDNILASCENPIYSGIDQVAYIFNKSDVTAITYETYTETDPDTQQEVERENRFLLHSLTLATGAKGYKIQNLGSEPFTNTTNDMTTGTTLNRFTHQFVFTNPDNGVMAATTNTNIANGKFIVIYNNEYEGSDGTASFEVVGAAKGAVCTAQTQPKYGENEGANTITLTETNSPFQSQYLQYNGNDYDTTKAYLDSLCE